MAKAKKAATPYSQATREAILARLEAGETLRAICRSEGMPSKSLVLQWAAVEGTDFAAQYARAREAGYRHMAEEILDIADEVSVRDDVDPRVVQRDKLRIDTRKWLLSKALPKIYGDKVALTDAEGGNVVFQVVSGVPRGTDGT